MDVMRDALAAAAKRARGPLTQHELGERTGRTQSQVSEVERGAVEMTVLRLVEIERASGREPGWILRQIGYLNDLDEMAGRLAADPALDDTGRVAVLATYNALVLHAAGEGS